jgi:ABC-type nitrate/sulfonate/bicarbonate transport system ATPase subunit/ABC-type transporter Mla maintaining outer membrane lipid asymmetry permease subunit MlaE
MCGSDQGARAVAASCSRCGHVIAQVQEDGETIRMPAAGDVPTGAPPSDLPLLLVPKGKSPSRGDPQGPHQAVLSTPRKDQESLLLDLRGLHVDRPDGTPLLRGVDLQLRAGEVVVLLGPSGAGKTTLGRVLLEPDALRRAGFAIRTEEVALRGSLGLVPQRGALFDYMDIAGNIRIALRHADGVKTSSDEDVIDWLRRVDLDEALADPGVPVTQLSGGQAQRVAVARTLAGGRTVLFLDEPSVGLDSARVRILAKQLRHQVEAHGAAAIVVTHDIPFAAGVADRLLMLDPKTGGLTHLFPGEWPGPFGSPKLTQPHGTRGPWHARLEEELVSRLGAEEERSARQRTRPPIRRLLRKKLDVLAQPFLVAGSAITNGAAQLVRRPTDFWNIFARVMRQALLRPLPFYAVVSILLGYTVLYVISGVAPAGVKPEKAVALLGSSHVVALVPPIGSFLFVAASGNAVNGWLGGMSLTKQIAALEALGIDRGRYLWGPALAGLFVSSIAVSIVIGLGMVIGGAWFCSASGIPDGWSIITTDFGDPRPERFPYLVRAWLLVFVYAAGIAVDVVAAGTTDKAESDEVTRAMTGSVVRCTLWVVALELLSTMILFALRGQ